MKKSVDQIRPRVASRLSSGININDYLNNRKSVDSGQFENPNPLSTINTHFEE